MRVGVLKEPEGENRVSIVPSSIKKLKKMGFEVVVETGAGTISHNSDDDYETSGCTVSSREDALSCGIVVSISMPEISIESLRKDEFIPFEDKLIEKMNHYKGTYVHAPKMS